MPLRGRWHVSSRHPITCSTFSRPTGRIRAERRELSTGTIKNRMATLRWWAEHIGRAGVARADNASYGFPHPRLRTTHRLTAPGPDAVVGKGISSGALAPVVRVRHISDAADVADLYWEGGKGCAGSEKGGCEKQRRRRGVGQSYQQREWNPFTGPVQLTVRGSPRRSGSVSGGRETKSHGTGLVKPPTA